MADETLNQAQKEEILRRLRRIEGQMRGIQRMVLEERTCESIVTQVMAARAALDKAGLQIMSHHIERCLGDPSESRAQLDRIISFFLKFAGAPPEGLVEAEDSQQP
ncbi:MAG: metal-sensitive transcriptional regulator [Anaerolineae bacterium]|nr:metal-sensitive transcriptional regulator [Anaerolineae bacterium]